jgi:hypothetical protein
MDNVLKIGDHVWYADFAFEVLAVNGNQVEILEHNPRIRLARLWVDASELERMTGEENDSFNYLVENGWGNG